MIDPKLFFAYLIESFEETESYLLNLDHLKLEMELLFLDKEDHPVLCYLPEYEKNILDQFRDFLEECIEVISVEDKKKVRFYYESTALCMRFENLIHRPGASARSPVHRRFPQKSSS